MRILPLVARTITTGTFLQVVYTPSLMKHIFFTVSLFTLLLSSCVEPISIGSDILEGDRADVGQTTSLPFTTRTVKDDSLFVFDAESNAALNSFSFGKSTDPIFGTWNNSVLFTPALVREVINQTVELPEFVTTDGVLVDSIVLILQIDTAAGFYGVDRNFPIEMRRLLEGPNLSEDQFSNGPRPVTGENLLEASSISVAKEERILFDTIYSQNRGDTVAAPHIRMKFTQEFVDEINLLDTSDFQNDTLFREIFQGVYLETVGDVNGYFSIMPRLQNGSSFSAFYFFYPDPSPGDDASFFTAPVRDWIVRYDQDFSGALVEELLADGGNSDTLLVGGTGSVMVEITFTDLDELDNTLINRSEIQFIRRALENYDYDLFAGADLSLFYRNSTGNLVDILDRNALIGGNNPSVVLDLLGGRPELDGDNIVYRNQLSVHLQGIVDGLFAEPKIYLRTVPTSNDPSRVILRGANSAEDEASIDVTFTQIQ